MRQCANCKWSDTHEPDPYDSMVGYDPDTIDGYLICNLALGWSHRPANTDPLPPMWADGNDGYESWLWVRPDHLCNAWEPAPEANP